MQALAHLASPVLALSLLSTLGLAQTSPATPPQLPPESPVPSQTTPPPAQETAPPELPDGPDTASQVPAPVVPTGPTALIDTSMGRLACKLYSKQAPVTVANFVGLANGSKDWTDPITLKKAHGQPFYDGVTFHRVIPEFMIQGGDRAGNGTGDPGYLFEDEFDPTLAFDVPGRLAMANSGPSTNGSQFFITEAPVPQLNGRHTIFGQCDSHSVDVVKAIARVPRDPEDKPLTPVLIRKVTIVSDGSPIPPDPMPVSPSTPAAPAQ